MSKKRYINDNIREDNYIMELDPSEKLLFIYLLTNNKVSLCGIYEIHIRKIQMELGFDKDLVHRIFSRFEKEDKIYYRDGYVFIANFVKNQSMNDNMKKGLERELTEIGKENLLLFYNLKGFERLGKDLKSLGILNFTLPNLTLPNLSGETPPKKSSKFISPTLDELKKYCDENSLLVDYESFYDYYETIGWVVGKAKVPMKNRKSGLSQWKRREKDRGKDVSDPLIKEYEETTILGAEKGWADDKINSMLSVIYKKVVEKYGEEKTKEIRKEIRKKHNIS